MYRMYCVRYSIENCRRLSAYEMRTQRLGTRESQRRERCSWPLLETERVGDHQSVPTVRVVRELKIFQS